MTNYSTGSGYAPKMSDEQAYELISPKVRKALQEAIQPWSSYHVMKYEKKNGIKATIEWLKNGDILFCKKGFVPALGRRKTINSSMIECKVSILYANW